MAAAARCTRLRSAAFAACTLLAGCNQLFGIEKLQPAANGGRGANAAVDAGVLPPPAGGDAGSDEPVAGRAAAGSNGGKAAGSGGAGRATGAAGRANTGGTGGSVPPARAGAGAPSLGGAGAGSAGQPPAPPVDEEDAGVQP